MSEEMSRSVYSCIINSVKYVKRDLTAEIPYPKPQVMALTTAMDGSQRFSNTHTENLPCLKAETQRSPSIARMIDPLYVIACGSLTFTRMPGASDRPNVSFSLVAGILLFSTSACTERNEFELESLRFYI